MANGLIPAHARNTTVTTNPDVLILDAWQRRNAAWGRVDADPPLPSAAEAEYIALADAAEEVIRTATAATPRGVEIQLWVSFSHVSDAHQRSVSELGDREDLASLLSQEDEFDYSTRMLLAALRSLKSMGA